MNIFFCIFSFTWSFMVLKKKWYQIGGNCPTLHIQLTVKALNVMNKVKAYHTLALNSYPLSMVYLDSTADLVCSIMLRPKAVTDWEISRQGSLPTWAPVNPYTELALIFSASWRPSNTFFLNGSVSFFKSVLAFFLADNRDSRISGSRPFLTLLLTNRLPLGVLMYWSGERLYLATAPDVSSEV